MPDSRQHIKKQRLHFANKHPHSQSYIFSSSHGWMWELDHKEGWEPKNWCFRTVVLAKTLESPLDCKKIQPVHPKGNQPWIFTGRTDAEAEAPILWPPDAKTWLKGKDWCRERLRAGGRGRRDWRRMRWLDSITDSMDMSLRANSRRWRTGKAGVLQSMRLQRVRCDLATEQQP